MKTIRLRSPRSFFALAALMLFAGCLKLDVTSGGLAVLVVIDGNGQTIPVNSASPKPLIVRAYDNSAAPLPNQTITWAVTSGGGTLSSASTITDQYGESSVTYTAGTTPGTVTITATSEDLVVGFTLTIT